MRIRKGHWQTYIIGLIIFVVISLPFAICFWIGSFFNWRSFFEAIVALPLLFSVVCLWRILPYLFSSPADHRYTQDMFRDGISPHPSEDTAMIAANIVIAINEQVDDDEETPQDVARDQWGRSVRYPCSKAIPLEVYIKRAEKVARNCAAMVAQAGVLEPEAAALLLTKAAIDYNGIWLGWGRSADADDYRTRAKPLLGRILSLLESAENMPADHRMFCLHEVASIGCDLEEYETACRAYSQLLPMTRTIVNDDVILATLLSNYAGVAARAGERSLAGSLKKEANRIWRKIPVDQIEHLMVDEWM